MYAFGIEILFPFVRDIDKIFYAAILNNASHVCKTIEGNDSLDAYWYDRHLVRAIYWLKVNHPKSFMGTTAPTTEAASARAGSSRVRLTIPADRLRSIIGNLINGEVINDGYDDEDDDIIDSFFENVFYLISVREILLQQRQQLLKCVCIQHNHVSLFKKSNHYFSDHCFIII